MFTHLVVNKYNMSLQTHITMTRTTERGYVPTVIKVIFQRQSSKVQSASSEIKVF